MGYKLKQQILVSFQTHTKSVSWRLIHSFSRSFQDLLYTPQIQVHKANWVSTTLKRCLKFKCCLNWACPFLFIYNLTATMFQYGLPSFAPTSSVNPKSETAKRQKGHNASDLPSAAHKPQKKQNVLWAGTSFLLPASVKTTSTLTQLERVTIGEKE